MANLLSLVVKAFDDCASWQTQNFADLEVPQGDTRIGLCAGCYSIAIEFQTSILTLLKNNQFALCLASQRLLFEALTRGLWLRHSANEKQLEDFINGNAPRKLSVMTAGISTALGGDVLGLENLRSRVEVYLHDFAHTGIHHVSRRYTDQTLGPNYTVHDMCLIVDMTCQMGMQAAMELFSVCGRNDLREQGHAQVVAYRKAYAELRSAYPGILSTA